MNIEVVSDSSYQRRVKVVVPSAQVVTAFDKAYDQLKRKAKVAGFRPGKAPRTVLEQRFGPQVENDVANDLIQKAYSQALADNGLEPVGRPQVKDANDIKSGTDFSFTISVEVKPSVTLTTYTGLDVVWPKLEVSDAEIDTSVQRKLEAAARLAPVEGRAAEAGDMVLAELNFFDGETSVHTAPGALIRTAGDTYYAGIESLLVGGAIDETRSGEVTIAESARTPEIAGKTLRLDAKIQSISANHIPELTDAIADELGYEGGVTGLREAVRAEISKGRDELARNQARANVLTALIQANPFTVPAGMVEENLKRLTRELALQQAYLGRDPRTITYTKAQMDDLRMRAEFATKAALILEFVWDAEKIVINEDDLELKYQELADERGQTIEAVKGWFQKEEAIEELRERMREERTLDWLLEHANPISATPAAPAAEADAPEAASETPAEG
jgi:trigger factor